MNDYTNTIVEHIKFCNNITLNMEKNDYPNSEVYINCNIYNQAEGSSIVHLNNTIVTCGLKVKIHMNQNINQHIPLNKGILVTNVELTPLCSKNIRPGLPGEESQCLTDQLKFILSRNGPDLDKLVIKENKVAYVLYLDFIVLNHSGNLLDACLLAANAVLQSAKIPKISWNSDIDNVEILNPEDTLSIPMTLKAYSITYGLKDNKALLHVDETMESYLKDDLKTVTFIINEDGNCMMPIVNGCLNDVKQKLLRDLIPSAIDRMKFLNEAVFNASK